MAEINPTGGSHPITPAERTQYEQDYKKSANLFQETLDQYTKSDNAFQKAEYKDVMDKAMDVLNQAAAALKRQELLKQNEKIAADYASFQRTDDPAKLKTDLDQAKKALG